MMHSRQSLYPSQHHQQSLGHLQSCVASTDLCVQTLQASIDTLEHATQDFGRLKVVLSSKRHYDLIAESDIHKARTHVSAEVEPHINELVARATIEMEKQERKAIALRNKASAQQARLDQLEEIDEMSLKAAEAEKRRREASSIAATVSQGEAAKLRQMIATERKRLEQLKQKREELTEKVDLMEDEQRNQDQDEEEL